MSFQVVLVLGAHSMLGIVETCKAVMRLLVTGWRIIYPG